MLLYPELIDQLALCRSHYRAEARASIWLKNWVYVGLGLKTGDVVGSDLKTGGVVGPNNSTDGGMSRTIEGIIPRIYT